MAKELLHTLNSNQQLDCDEYHMRNVMTAALCHDIGHGPFSHTFDNNFVQKRFPELNWCHELCSADLVEYTIDSNNIEGFEKEDIKMIQDLIMGKPHQLDNPELYANDLYGDRQRAGFDFQKDGWLFELGKFFTLKL